MCFCSCSILSPPNLSNNISAITIDAILSPITEAAGTAQESVLSLCAFFFRCVLISTERSGCERVDMVSLLH